MNDQYRPQPYDDGPRMTVDPHLLPQRPASASAKPGAEDASAHDAATVENPDAQETSAETPTETNGGTFAVGSNGETSHEQAEGDFTAPAPSNSGDTRLSEALARSRAIPVDDAPSTASDDVASTADTSANTHTDAYGDGATDTTTRAYDTEAFESDSATATRRDDVNAAPLAMPTAAVNSDTTEPDIYADTETTTLDEPTAARDETATPSTSPTEGLIIEPDKRGNRGFAFFTALLATVVFGALYAVLFAAVRIIFTAEADFVGGLLDFIGTAPFYVPVAIFGVFLIVWSLIANRAGWWSYILASLLVAVLTGIGYYVGVAFQDVVNGQPWSNEAFVGAIRTAEHLPGALLAVIAARESALWIGGIAALRGRRIKKKNADARAEYDRKVAEERDYEAQRSTLALDSER